MTTAPPRKATAVPPARSASAERLLARLEEPATAAALNSLLDNAELLALLVGSVDGLLRRSETITDNLVSGLAEFRRDLPVGDGQLRAQATELAGVLPALAAAAPALKALLASDVLKPETVAALSTFSGALAEGVASPVSAGGWRPLLKQLRSEDSQRGLGVLLAVAKALGRRAGR